MSRFVLHKEYQLENNHHSLTYADILAENKELKQQNALLQIKSRRDPLTGVPNRRDFDEVFAREAAQARRNHEALCLAIVDVDHFKAVNDVHGHPTGDRMLVRLAEILQSASRETDYVARIGGEEFVIVLPNTNIIGAHVYLERLRKCVENELAVKSDAGVLVSCTVSIGIDQLRAGQEPHELMVEADRALYRAKESGRNRVALRTLNLLIV